MTTAKPRKIYRYSSKDENEIYCFIGSTSDLKRIKLIFEKSINSVSLTIANSEIYEYIRNNGGLDTWVFEEIPINEHGDDLRKLRRYKVGEYENMTEESKMSKDRREFREIYNNRKSYKCECGKTLYECYRRIHEMSLRHMEYIREMQYNRAHKIQCQCGIWIHADGLRQHVKTQIHNDRMLTPPHERD